MTKQSDILTASGIPVHIPGAEVVDVTELKGYPRNNRAHGDEQVALLAKNIRAMGWRWPIIVSRRSGYIVAGHGRMEAAKLLKVATVPVVFQDFATARDEDAFRLADNRIPELAEAQLSMIKDLLEELDTGDFDMDLTGYAEKVREQMATAYHVDEVAPPNLACGDRAPFRQATFTLHDEQWETVEAAIRKAKAEGHGESAVNENSNGNALAWIAEVFNRG